MWPLQPCVDIHDILMASNRSRRPVRLWSEATWNQLRYIQRIDEMERIIRFLLEELTKARISKNLQVAEVDRHTFLNWKWIKSRIYIDLCTKSLQVQIWTCFRFGKTHFISIIKTVLQTVILNSCHSLAEDVTCQWLDVLPVPGALSGLFGGCGFVYSFLWTNAHMKIAFEAQLRADLRSYRLLRW